MLNITKTVNDKELTIALEGRLDTVTSPVLESELQNSLDGIEKLIMDMKNLQYISSAGLRVLLTARKGIQGELVLKNVASSVREVLEITGFVDILTIE